MSRIAVLYLGAKDESPDVAAIADGLTESLIARLRGVEGLTVISRNGVRPYRGGSVRIDTIAARLGVGTVIAGNVRQDGDQVKITVRLLDKSDSELETISLSQPIATALAMRDSLSQRVAQQLRKYVGQTVKLSERRAGTDNAQAWTLLQRGERARLEADSLATAEQPVLASARLDVADSLFRRAAALDADWADPVTLLGRTALARAEFARGRQPVVAAWLDSATKLGTAALTIEPEDPDAFEVRGTARALRVMEELVSGPDARDAYTLARADLDSATTFEPKQASAWNMLGRLEYTVKNVAAAKAMTAKAQTADAFLADAPNITWRLFITSHDLDQYPDAKKYCDQGYATYPAQPRFTACKLYLQTMYGESTDPRQLWRIMDSLRVKYADRWEAFSPQFNMLAAAALAKAGLKDSALHVLERAHPKPGQDPTDELMGYEAFVYTQLGDKERAIQLLTEYVGKHPEHIKGFKQGDFWWWRPLKGDPRFDRIQKLAQ